MLRVQFDQHTQQLNAEAHFLGIQETPLYSGLASSGKANPKQIPVEPGKCHQHAYRAIICEGSIQNITGTT
jgi:hypothetical protein